jgi:uncharacterized protein (TIGR03067 family)
MLEESSQHQSVPSAAPPAASAQDSQGGRRPSPRRAPFSVPRPAGYAGPRFETGSLRLFRVFGIDVFLHWSWFIAAYFQFRIRPTLEPEYSSPGWYVAEYLALFAIVVLHEFGHALACRSVGGTANRIYLWPLGGVAFVNPPPRPGPFLWSIAAGPLVNLLLVPLTVGVCLLVRAAGLGGIGDDFPQFLLVVASLNGVMLLLNLLPIFPLDGGQLLQGLLWLVIGRAWSLLVVAVLGLPVALGGLLYALVGLHSTMLALIAGFAVLACLAGLVRARLLLRVMKAPRREGFRCPACGVAPPEGVYWACGLCRTRYDAFAHAATCPGCGVRVTQTMCADCHQSRPFAAWRLEPEAASADVAPRPRVRPAAAASAVPLGERLLWGAGLGGIVLAAGLAIAGSANLVPVGVVALGGVMLGATGAEHFSRGWRTRAARRRFEGTWRLVERDGEDLSRRDGPPVRLTITGNRLVDQTGDDVTGRGLFWFDPMKRPAPINLTRGDGAGPYLGIYEFDGDLLRLCLAVGDAPRPEALAFEPDRRRLLVYRREDPAVPTPANLTDRPDR